MRKPTVTELIGLLDKPALMKWANKIGLEGISLDKHRELSQSKGTSLHKQIQDYVENKTPFLDPIHQKAFDNFHEYKQVIEVEKKIETDWFVGRYDAKIMVYPDTMYLCDFKSSSGLYFENKLQLTAYKMAHPDCKIAVVEIPNFIFKPIEIDFKKYELILKCLHKIWELKQQL